MRASAAAAAGKLGGQLAVLGQDCIGARIQVAPKVHVPHSGPRIFTVLLLGTQTTVHGRLASGQQLVRLWIAPAHAHPAQDTTSV